MNTYNISVFTENNIGILNRITIIFTRRHVNIHSITASECEEDGIYRYTIVIKNSEEQVIKIVNQIEKLVDVIKAFYYEDKDVVYQELALYKLPYETFKNQKINILLKRNDARIISIDEKFVTLEKTGNPEEIFELFQILKPLGVFEYVKSGRVAISKPMKTLKEFLT
ncbi:MAG: acetolactate synthase small subunit [Crocinitomicaceae bacterium]|nr:acetolactate synthase small subunit [Crocinitomicaceae bacterium]